VVEATLGQQGRGGTAVRFGGADAAVVVAGIVPVSVLLGDATEDVPVDGAGPAAGSPGLPLRQTEGFLDSLLSLMGLDLKAPDHTLAPEPNR
jgi:hypothetical protein